MPTYNETSYCPCCGTKTIITVRAYGDYDSPDKPRETDPSTCLTCEGIRIANPAMHSRLMSLWAQIKRERDENQKRIADVEKNSFTEHQLYSKFHQPYFAGTLAKIYAKAVKEHTSCTDNKDPNDRWVKEESAKEFAFKVIKIATGKFTASPTYR